MHAAPDMSWLPIRSRQTGNSGGAALDFNQLSGPVAAVLRQRFPYAGMPWRAVKVKMKIVPRFLSGVVICTEKRRTIVRSLDRRNGASSIWMQLQPPSREEVVTKICGSWCQRG
jgi:hypothetical protein